MRRSVLAAASGVPAARGVSVAGRAAGAFDEALTGGAGLAVTVRSGVNTMSLPGEGVAAGSFAGTDADRSLSASGTPAAMTMPAAIAAIFAGDARRGDVVVARAVAGLTLSAESR